MEKGYQKLAMAILADAAKSGGDMLHVRRALRREQAALRRSLARKDPQAVSRNQERVEILKARMLQSILDRRFLRRPNEVLGVWAGVLGHSQDFYIRRARPYFASRDKEAAALERRP